MEHDHGLDLLAQRLVVHADDGHLGHGLVLDEPVLDLDRVDVLAAPDDQVAAPALEEQQPVVDATEVARGVPPVGVEHPVRGLLVAPVPQEHLGALHVDLADLAVGQLGAVGVADLDAVAGHGPADRGTGVVVVGRLQDGDRPRRLGHAVADAQRHAHLGQHRGRVAQQLRGEHRSPTADQLQLRQVELGEPRVVDQSPQLGGHERPLRDVVALGQLEVDGLVPASRGCEHQAGPPERRVGELAEEPRHVEQRRAGDDGGHAATAGGDVVDEAVHRGRRRRREAELDDVAVRQRRSLGPPGRSAGEHDRRGVVLGDVRARQVVSGEPGRVDADEEVGERLDLVAVDQLLQDDVVAQHQLAGRRGDRVLELIDGPRRVERGGDGTHRDGGPQGDDVVDRRDAGETDPVPRHDAVLIAEAEGDRRDLGGQPGEGDRALVADERLAVTVLCSTVEEHLADRRGTQREDGQPVAEHVLVDEAEHLVGSEQSLDPCGVELSGFGPLEGHANT